MKKYHVYIITNYTRSTLYIGMTGNLEVRIKQYKEAMTKSFSSRYKLKYLIYYEEFNRPMQAIRREKQLKSWRRQWKVDLILEQNPQLIDLSADWE